MRDKCWKARWLQLWSGSGWLLQPWIYLKNICVCVVLPYGVSIMWHWWNNISSISPYDEHRCVSLVACSWRPWHLPLPQFTRALRCRLEKRRRGRGSGSHAGERLREFLNRLVSPAHILSQAITFNAIRFAFPSAETLPWCRSDWGDAPALCDVDRNLYLSAVRTEKTSQWYKRGFFVLFLFLYSELRSPAHSTAGHRTKRSGGRNAGK